MKKALLLLFLIANIQAFSQNRVSVKWGSSFKYNMHEKYLGIFKESEGKYFVVNYRRFNKFKSKVFNKNAEMVEEAEFNVSEDKKLVKNATLLGTVTIGDKNYIIESFENDDSKSIEIHAFELVSNGIKSDKIIYEYSLNGLKKTPSISFNYQPESENTILYIVQQISKDENPEQRIIVLNKEFKKSREVTFVTPPEKRPIVSFAGNLFDSEGRFYSIYQNSIEKASGNTLNWNVRCYDVIDKKIKNYSIEQSDYTLYNVAMRYNTKKGKLALFAFMTGAKSKPFTSFLYREISPEDGTISLQSISEIPTSTYKKLITKSESTDNVTIPYFTFDNAVWGQSGNCTFVAECRYSTKSHLRDRDGTYLREITTYYNPTLCIRKLEGWF